MSTPISAGAETILHQGDCIHVMQRMPDGTADFVLTDPPYLVGYRDRQGRTIQNDTRADWLAPGGHRDRDRPATRRNHADATDATSRSEGRMRDPITIAGAALQAIETLSNLLDEAQGYFESGQDRAALGTLVSFPEAARNLEAVLQIYRMLTRTSNPDS